MHRPLKSSYHMHIISYEEKFRRRIAPEQGKAVQSRLFVDSLWFSDMPTSCSARQVAQERLRVKDLEVSRIPLP